MATIYDTIIDKFVAELSDKKLLSPKKLDALHALLQADSKLRPEELIAIFLSDEGEVA